MGPSWKWKIKYKKEFKKITLHLFFELWPGLGYLHLFHIALIHLGKVCIQLFFLLLNKSWRQLPTRHQLYGHLPLITKTIQVRRTRHAGHCWRSRDELISDVLLWTPTYGRLKAGWPARTYIQQLCEDMECSPEDLPEAMNDREKWREGVGYPCLWHDMMMMMMMILSPATGELEGRVGALTLLWQRAYEKENSEFKSVKCHFKDWPYVISCLCKYTHPHIYLSIHLSTYIYEVSKVGDWLRVTWKLLFISYHIEQQGRCFSFPWIALLYPWSVPYNVEC